jgi:hypothetical protein
MLRNNPTTAKKFLHNPVNLPDLETINIDGKRHYVTPAGNFPSVTTVLGEKLNKSGLNEWRVRVGETEANKISTQASNRATAIHSICENYLNGVDYTKGVMPVNIETFSKIRPHLDKNIGSVYGIEVPLWSARLKTAGRCDLLAGYDGVNSVIDFKTSRKLKKEYWIESYFLQTTCYSLMAEDLTGLKFPQIVVIVAVDHEETQIFVKKREDYIDRVLQVFS